MATQTEMLGSDTAGGGDADGGPPADRRMRFWRWGPSAFALLLGGVLTAAGGGLRWWGPQRLDELVMRENDDADPLHMGWTEHVAPGSGELVASGQMLVAIGLVLLLLLPWGRTRLVAAPLLLVGALGVAFRPGIWIQWWALGRPHGDFPGWWPANPAWLEQVGGVADALWHTGFLALLLAGLAAWTSSRPGSDRRPWLTLIPMCLWFLLSAAAVEYFFAFLLFLSDSHDDPVGTHVVSGLATVAAGGLLAWSGLRGRGTATAATDTPVSGRSPRLRMWSAAGILLIASGVLDVALILSRPSAEVSVTQSPTMIAWRLGADIMALLAYAALAAGPWSGLRRVVAVGVLVVLMVLSAIWMIASPIAYARGIDVESLPAPIDAVVGILEIFGGTGLSSQALVVVAIVLMWENASRRRVRGGAVALVVVATVVLHACTWWLMRSLAMSEPDAWATALAAVPGVLTALLGAAWWWAGRTGRSMQRPVAA